MNISIESGKAFASCVFTKSAFKAAIAEAGHFETGNIHIDHGWRKDDQPCLWCHVKRIVLFDDAESVSLVDSKVWRDNASGTAFMEQGPNAEQRARESAMTHKRCNTCSELYRKNGYCSNCASEKERMRFARLKPVEYKKQVCVIGDNWFFDQCTLQDYLLEHDIRPVDAEIEEASPDDLPEIELEHWHDHLPEDYDEYTLNPEIMDALAALNAAIKKHGENVSYYRNGNRVVLPDDFLDAA